MLSDTGLYLNWNPTSLLDDEDEEEEDNFEPWPEDDYQGR
jgi:hypothetical protein